jgi:hypothetical protein
MKKQKKTRKEKTEEHLKKLHSTKAKNMVE